MGDTQQHQRRSIELTCWASPLGLLLLQKEHSMSIQGWYYLHTNGELIYKKNIDNGVAADIRESDFALGMWPVDPTNRLNAWTIVVEGLAAGATRSRVMELADKWKCDDVDADIYAKLMKIGVSQDDNNRWIATRNDSRGIGETKLDAFADLARNLGYKPSKMWGPSFADLLAKHETINNEFPFSLENSLRPISHLE